ncbi:amidase [Allomuricauda taeanensis]|uniref:amidase n=1 Tax=Flagellimonas taeanensis TaxID=1005926 RepID=UPI002E7B0AF5|nr:amidase [Allomuricauda taeanensis]MEE1961271.1 amidase [Allomuricauda taeanensis]
MPTNLKISPFLCFFALICLISCASKREFTKRDVKKSERLIGIHFSKEARDTLYPYLQRNREGFDSLRKYPLDNAVFPAIRFDPIPFGFEMPEQWENQTWEIPDHVEIPEPYDLLAFYTIPQLASLIKHQKITSTELTQFFLDRLKKYQPMLQCSITITDSLAMAQAKRADQEIKSGQYRGILHGIPYGTKDLMSVAGYPTTWGAAPYKDQEIDQTATVIERLEESGAILVAKLVSGALARGDVWFGGKTKNPWDTTQGASGSSAGSGSATSAGLVPFALGTETLGSITSPSTRNGVTGLRPTYGRVSRHGVMSLSWSMDKVGPLGRNAEDCAIVFAAIQGKDEKDLTTIDLPFGVDWKKDITSLKVAYLKEDIEKDTTQSGDNLRNALETLKSIGIEPTAVKMPEAIPYRGFDIILRAEAGAFFDALVRSGKVDEMVEQDQRSRANSLRQSRFIPAVEYLQASRQRQVLMQEMNTLMKDYDVLISPSFGNDQLLATNLTGHPVIAIPTGLDDKKHPTSMTFVGNLYDEASILLLAKAFQERTGFDEMHPPGF